MNTKGDTLVYNAEAGYGTENRYLGRLFAMRYTPQSRLSLFGNLNNVNDRRKPDGNGGCGDFDVSGGLTSTKRGGLDYSVFDKRDRFQLSGNADVTYTDNENAWGGNSTNFLLGGDVFNVTCPTSMQASTVEVAGNTTPTSSRATSCCALCIDLTSSRKRNRVCRNE